MIAQTLQRALHPVSAFCCAAIAALAVSPRPAPAQDGLNIAAAVVRIQVVGTTDEGHAVNQWGSGFFINQDGRILTAFHVVGRDGGGQPIRWRQPSSAEEANPVITVDRMHPTHHYWERLPNLRAVVIAQNDALDVALLDISGQRWPAARCSTLRPNQGAPLRGVGLREGREVADNLPQGEVQPSEARDGLRLRLVGMSSSRGHSGGPIYVDGAVVGVITSGRDRLLVPGAPETFATAMADVIASLPGIACDGPPTALARTTDVMRLRSECSVRKLRELSERVDRVATSGSVRCEGGGVEGRSDTQRRFLEISARPGHYLDGPAAVAVTSSNSGSHSGPFYQSASGSQLVTAARIEIQCRSPSRMFGPGAWHAVTLSANERRIVDQALREEIAGSCRLEYPDVAGATTE